MIRACLAAAAILLWLLLLLMAAAGVYPGDPWQARQQREFSGNTLFSIAGQASQASDGLVVSGLGKYAQGLQSWKLDKALPAERFPVLRYQLKNFPRSLELVMIFRTAEQPRDVTSVTLPWPGNAQAGIDLSRLPAWRGHVLELGFSEYPTPSLVPADTYFRPFTLVGAKLESRSWQGQWQALMTDWFAWRPWSMRSINALRSDNNRLWQRSLPLIVFLAAVGSVLLLWLSGLLRGRARLVGALLTSMLLAWLILDLRWLSQLQRNNLASHALYGNKPYAERRLMVADSLLQAQAQRLRSTLAQQRPGVHVLLWAPSQIDSIRLGYFLRPYNVGPLFPGMQPASIPDGSLMLAINSDMSWNWDSRRSLLQRGGFALHGDLLWRQDGMLLLSVRKAAGR